MQQASISEAAHANNVNPNARGESRALEWRRVSLKNPCWEDQKRIAFTRLWVFDFHSRQINVFYFSDLPNIWLPVPLIIMFLRVFQVHKSDWPEPGFDQRDEASPGRWDYSREREETRQTPRLGQAFWKHNTGNYRLLYSLFLKKTTSTYKYVLSQLSAPCICCKTQDFLDLL